LSTANSNADDGDIVYLRGGSYGSQVISPSNSGSSGRVITFIKYESETPSFSGSRAVDINGKSYIRISGITVTAGTNRQVYVHDGSSYIEIDNIRLSGASDYGGLYLHDTSYSYVHDSYFMQGAAGRIEETEADSISLGGGANHNRIINNTFTDGNGHATIMVTQSTSQYNVIRGNTIVITDTFDNDHDTQDMCIQVMKGASYNLIEGNTMHEMGTNPVDRTEGLKNDGAPYNIWRKNIVYNLDHYGWGCYDNVYHHVDSNTVYQNTFYNVAVHGTTTGGIDINAGSAYYARYNQFVNNIVATSGKYGVYFNPNYESHVLDNKLRNTIIYDITNDDVYHFGDHWTVAQAESRLPDANGNDISGSVTGDPELHDPSYGDMSLDAGSSAIDAGAWLTIITSSTGSDSSFTVDNPYFFYDGWSIPGETGDTIKTENGQTTTIQSINYGTNTINVNPPINIVNGEGLALDYSGSRPDIGAVEYTSGGTCTPSWSCTDTDCGSCVNNQMQCTEICTDLNDCQTPTSTPVTRSCQSQQTGPVAYWAFDEGTGTTAHDSSGSNDGTLTNGPTWTTGKIGAHALSFNGFDNYVRLSADLNQWLGGTASLSVWIKTSQTGNSVWHMAPGITGIQHSGDPNDVFWGWIDDSGRINIQAGDTAGAGSSNPINDNQWHHIAMTRDQASGEVRMYVDGNLNDTETSGIGIKTTPFYGIGRIDDTGSTIDYFNGEIDEVRIYNRVLSASEIQNIYLQGDGSSCNSLADFNSDGVISISELINYISQWKAGSVTISSLIDAIGKWKSGCN
jgi:hypothetical protein